MCQEDETCISSDKVCDGVVDCGAHVGYPVSEGSAWGASDEIGCGKF